MKTKIKFTRFILALLLALSALGISTSTALADKPVKFEWTLNFPGVIEGVCSFSVDVYPNARITETDFFDQSGALTRIDWHTVEQDTFTANGKSLVGIPFHFHAQMLFDSAGNLMHLYADGVTEKIWLPDGSLFISAGRVDFAVHGFPAFILSPDNGNPGNIAGFCAALAP